MLATELQTLISLKNILVPTDFSPASDAALRVAHNIARRYGSTLYIAHVIVPEIYTPGLMEGMPLPLEDPRKRVEEELKRIRDYRFLREVQHEEIIRQGMIWEELESIMREKKIDLIVTGTHGSGGIAKVLLGSIAEEIFRKASSPVITTGPHVPEESLQTTGFQQILFPTDLSPQSLHAAPYAFSLAQEYHSRLTVLRVIEDLKDSSPHDRIAARTSYTEELKRRVPSPPNFWRAIDYEVLFGTASDVIVQSAVSLHANLIVLGIRKAEGFASHLPWATASRVVRFSTCPVLTVRQ